MKIKATKFFIVVILLAGEVHGYEVNNHADMTQNSAQISVLNDLSLTGKLARLGLRAFPLADIRQTFPLVLSTAIRACFGEYRDAGGQPQQDGTLVQPPWVPGGRTPLTIVQLFRYGACYEDSTDVALRPVAHFYNPQNNGAGLSFLGLTLGPNSPDWVLKRAPGNTGNTEVNHYTWDDARDNFYLALTNNSAGSTPDVSRDYRQFYWARTFQTLGHVVHHLQDMAQPQHVRNDAHCDDIDKCRDSWKGLLGGYRPSAYEKFLQDRFQLVRNLAANASAPIMFGLPREFWSMQGDSITGSYPANQGIAAYTSTNYVSAGTDFMMVLNNGYTGAARADLPYPQPAAQPNDVSLAELFAGTPPANLTAIRDGLCSGDLSTCKMRFYGSVAQPNTRKSSVSFFSQALLGGTSPQGLQARRAGYFTQNYFTYANAAADLIPKAVEYSAGLINYFFRGEMEISLPEEGVYGIVDHAVTKEKGDGYKLIKMKVKNTTADLNTARGVLSQAMTAGQFVAVAKFRRNTCYTADLSGQIGQPGKDASCRTAVEEIVVSAPGTEVSDVSVVIATKLLAQAEKTLAFDFTANPVPIEATDLYLQVVFKGTLGEEIGAVAVTTKDVSEPSFYTYMNALDRSYCVPYSWATYTPPSCSYVPGDPSPVASAFSDSVVFAITGDTYGVFNGAAREDFFRAPGRSGWGPGSLEIPPPNRWMGFNNADTTVKLIEWGGFFDFADARLSSLNGRVYGVPAGRVSRVAFLADLKAPTPPSTTHHDQDEIDVTVGLDDNWDMLVSAPQGDCPVSNYAVAPFPSKARATRAQDSDTGGALGSTDNPLPDYLTLRGVTMSLKAHDFRGPSMGAPAQMGGFYSSVVYHGEFPDTYFHTSALRTTSMNALPRQTTVLQRYPEIVNKTPLPVRSLRFETGAPHRLAVPTCKEYFDWHTTRTDAARSAYVGFNALVPWREGPNY